MFEMWFGAAGGSAQKAMRRLEIENVLLSYSTKNNRPWDAIDRLAVDSGGYSVLRRGREYDTPPSEYVNYLRDHEERLEWFALRDYPAADELLSKWNRSVDDHQRRTLDAHRDVLLELDERPVDADIAAVAQGTTPHEYAEHVDALLDAFGPDIDRIAAGSLVGRDPDDVAAILDAVRDAAPNHLPLHGFGVSRDDLALPQVRRVVDSVDSCSYEQTARREASEGISCNWQHVMAFVADFRRRIIELQHADPHTQ